jgi:hypothetical protein
MASKVMDWGDSRQGTTKEDLIDALSRLEHASEEEVRGWIDRVGIDESDFKPLDKNVANEVERLSGSQVQQLMHRWKNDWTPPSLPKELSEPLEEWRGHLDKRCVGDYCAAAGALIRSFLLDASAEVEALGRIESPRRSPTLHVFAEPGSVLALEQGFEQGGDVRIGPGQFGHQIALRCGEPGPWGELAWLSLAGSLVEMEADNVLPRLAVRQARDGTIEIRLAATTDEE